MKSGFSSKHKQFYKLCVLLPHPLHLVPYIWGYQARNTQRNVGVRYENSCCGYFPTSYLFCYIQGNLEAMIAVWTPAAIKTIVGRRSTVRYGDAPTALVASGIRAGYCSVPRLCYRWALLPVGHIRECFVSLDLFAGVHSFPLCSCASVPPCFQNGRSQSFYRRSLTCTYLHASCGMQLCKSTCVASKCHAIARSFLARLFTGHNPTLGSCQKVFKILWVGSGRVGSSRVRRSSNLYGSGRIRKLNNLTGWIRFRQVEIPTNPTGQVV